MSIGGPLRSIVMIGGSQMVNIITSILRVKMVALMLGPSGVGMMGLFQNLNDLSTTSGGLGLPSSAVRNIALNRDDPAGLAQTWQVLLWALALQGAVTALVIWALRATLAERLFGTAIHPDMLGLIALSVWVGMMASSMTAVIQGLRRIGDLARVTVLGAWVGTALGLVAILWLGLAGLPILILGLATGRLLAAGWILRRTPVPSGPTHAPLRDKLRIWAGMVKLGSVFMMGTLLTTATLLLVRSLIQQQLGLEAVGQFEASWALTITYVGFILQAMSADYYPRLSGAIHNHAAANRLVNEQIQIGLVLGGPLLLLMIGLAPVAVTLLYSSEFHDATDLLRWQTVGNVFKLSAWALGFLVLAKGRGGLFLLLELGFNFCFGGLLWWYFGSLGIMTAGVAFAAAYVLYFAATLITARQLTGFRWEHSSLVLQSFYGLTAVVLLILALYWPFIGAVASVLCALIGCLLGLKFLVARLGTGHPVANRIASLFNRVGLRIRP